nr:MAG TPA: hypothetical protein [Caudoviricetes sp.]
MCASWRPSCCAWWPWRGSSCGTSLSQCRSAWRGSARGCWRGPFRWAASPQGLWCCGWFL